MRRGGVWCSSACFTVLSSLGLLRQRVLGFHQRPQTPFGHMRVNLRGGNICVAEQRLHRAQVRAAFDQVCRERVPQHVRRHARGIDPAFAAAFSRISHAPAKASACRRRRGGRKQPALRLLALRLGLRQRGTRAISNAPQSRPPAPGFPQRHQPLFAALALGYHVILPSRGAARSGSDTSSLTRSRAVHQLDQRLVPPPSAASISLRSHLTRASSAAAAHASAHRAAT